MHCLSLLFFSLKNPNSFNQDGGFSEGLLQFDRLYFTGEVNTGPRTPDVSHQCWAEGKDDPPRHAGSALPNAAQDATVLD